jgi:hypothetical protein
VAVGCSEAAAMIDPSIDELEQRFRDNRSDLEGFAAPGGDSHDPQMLLAAGGRSPSLPICVVMDFSRNRRTSNSLITTEYSERCASQRERVFPLLRVLRVSLVSVSAFKPRRLLR